MLEELQNDLSLPKGLFCFLSLIKQVHYTVVLFVFKQFIAGVVAYMPIKESMLSA